MLHLPEFLYSRLFSSWLAGKTAGISKFAEDEAFQTLVCTSLHCCLLEFELSNNVIEISLLDGGNSHMQEYLQCKCDIH